VLLTLIANKIGDPAKKIASAAGHQLRRVLEEHPAMVNVIAREVSFEVDDCLIFLHCTIGSISRYAGLKIQLLTYSSGTAIGP
jgi:hypothetical protein